MDSPSFIFRFGPYELETGSRELSKHGTKLKLRGQPYLILEALVRRSGEVVTREEIRQSIWSSDTFVDFEHSLNTSIKKLRQILCDSATEPRYIETLPRMGYRFIAPVEVVAGERRAQSEVEAPQPTVVEPLPINGNGPGSKLGSVPVTRVFWIRAAAILALLVAAFLILGLEGKLKSRSLSGLLGGHADASAGPTGQPINSIAVLPLQNLSNDPSQDYFADGMSD